MFPEKMRCFWLSLSLAACAPLEEPPPEAPRGAAAWPGTSTVATRPASPPPALSSAPLPSAAAAPPAVPAPSAAISPTAPSAETEDAEEDAEVALSGSFSEPQRLVMKAAGLCLERALRHGPGPGGSLALDVTVDPDGAVTKVVMGPGYPASARPCVESRIKAIHFPEEKSGGTRFFRYPINEQPAE